MNQRKNRVMVPNRPWFRATTANKKKNKNERGGSNPKTRQGRHGDEKNQGQKENHRRRPNRQ